MADLLDLSEGLKCPDSMSVSVGERTFTLTIDRADSLTIRGVAPWVGYGPIQAGGTSQTLVMAMGVTPEKVNAVCER
jgi:hypothetical protein